MCKIADEVSSWRSQRSPLLPARNYDHPLIKWPYHMLLSRVDRMLSACRHGYICYMTTKFITRLTVVLQLYELNYLTWLVVSTGAQRSGRGGGLNSNGGVGEGYGGVDWNTRSYSTHTTKRRKIWQPSWGSSFNQTSSIINLMDKYNQLPRRTSRETLQILVNSYS